MTNVDVAAFVVAADEVAQLPPAPQYVPVKSFDLQTYKVTVSFVPPKLSLSNEVEVQVITDPGSIGPLFEILLKYGRPKSN